MLSVWAAPVPKLAFVPFTKGMHAQSRVVPPLSEPISEPSPCASHQHGGMAGSKVGHHIGIEGAGGGDTVGEKRTTELDSGLCPGVVDVYRVAAVTCHDGVGAGFPGEAVLEQDLRRGPVGRQRRKPGSSGR